MSQEPVLRHAFVEHIPPVLEEHTVYVSVEYATAVHRCCCGCGREVVTPLSPTDWRLIFDGETVSLDPSIGNWAFACRSHYWIRRGRVRWAGRWSEEEIAAGKARDRQAKARYYDRVVDPNVAGAPEEAGASADVPSATGWRRLVRWWRAWFA